jgi:precorrin-6B methylase 2
MKTLQSSQLAVAACLTLVLSAPPAAQTQTKPFEPVPGQAGKDVVWVPTPQVLVEAMLDLAEVTSRDFVMDLGSGDGRNIIAAARRGASAVGVEFNPDMVDLSRRSAQQAGVADNATFIEGDMYTADISKATVLALFLLPTNLDKLKDKFLALAPGTRIVLNTFGVTGWEADVTKKVEDGCETWCTAMLLIVPASVGGTWSMPPGSLVLEQSFQKVSGTLKGKEVVTISEGVLRGSEISFTADGAKYVGQVKGNRIEGTVTSALGKSTWTAEKR